MSHKYFIHSFKVGGYYTWDKRYLIVVIYVNTYTVDLVCKEFCRDSWIFVGIAQNAILKVLSSCFHKVIFFSVYLIILQEI